MDDETREHLASMLAARHDAWDRADHAGGEMGNRSFAQADALDAIINDLDLRIAGFTAEQIFEITSHHNPDARMEAARRIASPDPHTALASRLAPHEDPKVRALVAEAEVVLARVERLTAEFLRTRIVDQAVWFQVMQCIRPDADAVRSRVVACLAALLEYTQDLDDRLWLWKDLVRLAPEVAMRSMRSTPAETLGERRHLLGVAAEYGDASLADDVREGYVRHLASRLTREGARVSDDVTQYLSTDDPVEYFVRIADAILASERGLPAPKVYGDSILDLLNWVAHLAARSDGRCSWWAFLLGFRRARVDEVMTAVGAAFGEPYPWLKLTAYLAAVVVGKRGERILAHHASNLDYFGRLLSHHPSNVDDIARRSIASRAPELEQLQFEGELGARVNAALSLGHIGWFARVEALLLELADAEDDALEVDTGDRLDNHSSRVEKHAYVAERAGAVAAISADQLFMLLRASSRAGELAFRLVAQRDPGSQAVERLAKHDHPQVRNRALMLGSYKKFGWVEGIATERLRADAVAWDALMATSPIRAREMAPRIVTQLQSEWDSSKRAAIRGLLGKVDRELAHHYALTNPAQSPEELEALGELGRQKDVYDA